MKLLSLNIIEFAGLGARRYNLGGGLNVIEGANESGKSSLLAFIKFMLYGLGRRAAGAELGERERYLSWSGRRAAGSLTLLEGGRRWRIERELITQTRGSRESNIERLKILDDETGAEEHPGKCPGELFLGIPEAVFVSSCCVAQSNLAGINSAEVGAAIENLLFSASESMSADKATDILERARKTLLYKNGGGGLLFELRNERNSLKTKLNIAATNARNIMAREAMADEHRRQENEALEALRTLESVWDKSEIALTLERFDRVRELEQRHCELSEKLKQLEALAFPGGFVPGPDFAGHLGSLSRELIAAEASRLRAETELSRLESSPTYDPALSATAKFLAANASGSPESVLTSYRLLKSDARTARRLSGMLIVPGAIAAAAGILLLVLSISAPGLAALAAGGALIAGGLAALSSAKKKRQSLAAYLSKLGFKHDPGEAELSGFAESCFEAAELEESYISALDALRGVVGVRSEKLTELRSAGRAELAKTGADKNNDRPDGAVADENLAAALAEEGGMITDFNTARDTLKLQLEHIGNEIKALRQELKKYDEPLLRRRAEGLHEGEVISSEEYRTRRTELMLAIKTAGDKRADFERQLAVSEATTDKPGRLALMLEEKESKIAEYEFKHAALVMAGEALAEASGQLRRGVTPKLRRTAGELMGRMTGGRYSELGIDQDISVSVGAGGVTRPLAAMSGGTRDAAYISLRIALASLLCTGVTPTLLIDEGLSQLDEGRAANLLSMLAAWCRGEGGQCLIFTCHAREAALLKSRGESFKYIKI